VFHLAVYSPSPCAGISCTVRVEFRLTKAITRRRLGLSVRLESNIISDNLGYGTVLGASCVELVDHNVHSQSRITSPGIVVVRIGCTC
jgi:hypothetical protein